MLLQRELNKWTVTVYGLDGIEGVSKDVLLVSTVKHSKKFTCIRDLRRIYKTFCKCHQKLILVGSLQQLMPVEPIDQFVAYIKQRGGVIEISNAA